MALLDEILQANAGFRPEGAGSGSYQAQRRLCVVTCVDPRLTRFLPQALGIERGEAVLIRVPGARVAPGSELLRSLAAVLYINGCDEVLVLPHTDCGTARVTVSDLLDAMSRHGVGRQAIEGDVREFFGLVGDVRQAAAETARAIRESPLFPPGLPVHSALLDTATGQISVLERGYAAELSSQAAGTPASAGPAPSPPAEAAPPPLVSRKSSAPQANPEAEREQPLPTREATTIAPDGRVWVDSRRVNLPGQLGQALAAVRSEMEKTIPESQRHSMRTQLADAYGRAAGLLQLSGIVLIPLQEKAGPGTPLRRQIMLVKNQLPELPRPVAWKLLRALVE